MWPNPQLPFPFLLVTAWKISKYGVCPNTEKYGPGKIQYLDTSRSKFFVRVILTKSHGTHELSWTKYSKRITPWKVSRYGVISGPYFSVFSPFNYFLSLLTIFYFLLTIFYHVCLEYLYIQKRLETIVLLLACSNFFVFVQHVEACSRTLLSISSVTPSPYFRKK